MGRFGPVFSWRIVFLFSGSAVCGVVGCSGDGPQASGTKTDWLIVCDTQADCNAELGLSCLCGICTTTCSADSACEQGECGSLISTAEKCGNESEFALRGEQICLPHSAVECVEAELTTGSTLGESEPPSCEAAGALICEDFEGPLPAGYSTWGEGEASSGLQECEALESAGSLRLFSVDDGYTQTRMRLPTPVSTGSLHARFYLKVEMGGVLPEQLLLFEFWDQEEGLVDDRTTIYLNAGEQLEVFVGSSNQTLQAEPGAPLSRDEWHCVELGLELSDTAGSVMMNLEGTTIVDAAGVDTLPSDPVTVAVIEGLPLDGSQGTEVTFFIDDLIVATEPIGCN